MSGARTDDLAAKQVGAEWIHALAAKDFQRLASLCHAEMRSRLITPRRMVSLETAADCIQKLKNWYQDSQSIQIEHSRVAIVGTTLGIFYRLRCEENGEVSIVEQQLFCSLREDKIDELSLLCSGFHPIQGPVETPAAAGKPALAETLFQSHALLEVNAAGGAESTCAILTPSIRRKLGEIQSGQVLEVHVDDPSAREDIEAWCRLSGNELLKMEQGEGPELRFFLKKK